MNPVKRLQPKSVVDPDCEDIYIYALTGYGEMTEEERVKCCASGLITHVISIWKNSVRHSFQDIWAWRKQTVLRVAYNGGHS